MPSDEHGTYDEDAGSTTPVEGRCNAPLRHWESRYGELRYCTCLKESVFNDVDHDYCKVHSGRHALEMRAQEALQHGFYSKTVDHHYDKLDAWEKTVVHGLFESLMGDSHYEFSPEYETKVMDYSECDLVPSVADEDDTLELDVPYPTEKGDRAMSLMVASCMTLTAMDMQGTIMDSTGGTGMGEATTNAEAEYVGYDESSSKTFETLEELEEHHLNLPLSRVTRDRKELLKYGGVNIDGETGQAPESNYEFGDFDIEEADPEVGEDPTTSLDESESAKIRENASDS